MRTLPFRWLVLAWLPGCLLVQPLDDAKGSANGGSGGAGSTSHAGSSGTHTGGATASGGGAARGGATGASGGAPNPTGGAPSAGGGGVDFSLFTGTWTLVSGTDTTTCSGVKKTTAATPGGTDTFDVGTDSDLIFDADTQCPLLADVTDRLATGQPGQTCSFDDPSNGYSYDIGFTHFDFKISANGQTAVSTSDSVVVVTIPTSTVPQTCTSELVYNYTR